MGASAATSGLILVFLGATATAFESYSATEKASVKTKYRPRAAVAFASLIVSISAVIFAILADWMDAPGLAVAAFVLLCVALFGVLYAAFMSVSEFF